MLLLYHEIRLFLPPSGNLPARNHHVYKTYVKVVAASLSRQLVA